MTDIDTMRAMLRRAGLDSSEIDLPERRYCRPENEGRGDTVLEPQRRVIQVQGCWLAFRLDGSLFDLKPGK